MNYDCHRLDTQERVRFYENDFYVLSNFSAFRVRWRGIDFDTSEAAYHWERFCGSDDPIIAEGLQEAIIKSRSAHEAFALAQKYKRFQNPYWDEVKTWQMKYILRAKVDQHEYIKRKLLATGDRELVEDSWRDSFWGWGPDQNGRNELGKLWMQIRFEIQNEEDIPF